VTYSVLTFVNFGYRPN